MTSVTLEHEAPPATSHEYPDATNLSWLIICVPKLENLQYQANICPRDLGAAPWKSFKHHCTMVFRTSRESCNQAPLCREAQATRAAELRISSPVYVHVEKLISFPRQKERNLDRLGNKQRAVWFKQIRSLLIQSDQSSEEQNSTSLRVKLSNHAVNTDMTQNHGH